MSNGVSGPQRLNLAGCSAERSQDAVTGSPIPSFLTVGVRGRDRAPREEYHQTQTGLPTDLVDIGEIPGGGQLHLLRSGHDYSIQFEGDELMGNSQYLSEQILAKSACNRLSGNSGRVLIGGLGMGYTLGAALDAWSRSAAIVVVELVPQVVAWAKGPLAHISGRHIEDPRVSLRVGDIHDVILEAPDQFDAILLDVDNGPDALVKAENERLYCNWGLRAAHSALKSDGILAIWSAYPDPFFASRLEASGFDVEEERIPASPHAEDEWHNIWFAKKCASCA